MRTVAVIFLASALVAAAPDVRGADRSVRSVTQFRSVSPRLGQAIDLGLEAFTTEHNIVIGLELRNHAALERFLTDVQDPASAVYHQFLTPAEFNARYAPTPDAEDRIVDYLQAHGLRVTDRFPNRLVVGAVGSVAALERAFAVEMHAVALNGRQHYATVTEPTLPADLAGSVVGVFGLDDLTAMHSRARTSQSVPQPRAALGGKCCHFSPPDLATFYDDAVPYTGAGQTLIIAGAYAWKASDVTAFNQQWGLPPLPSGSGQVCVGTQSFFSSGCTFDFQNSIEISLDVEYAHGTAPGAIIKNYMAVSTALSDFTRMYNRIVTDNPGHVVSTSWGACEAGIPAAAQRTNDNIFANANAIGQSWFAASGDNGSTDCNGLVTVDHPANSPHVIGTGGTTPACRSGMTAANPVCGGYGCGVGWKGSGGGSSQVFARPAFQRGCRVPTSTKRLVPDVALAADPSPGNYVRHGGFWYIVGGTSAAAPQWAGFFAELNQKKGGAGLGNPGTRLYALCGTPAYHDIITGSNGIYNARVGYDRVTGLGSLDAQNLFVLY